MSFKHLCRQLVISGTLLIWGIKFLIRPYHLYPVGTGFLLGVAPNLLGSFLLPFGAYWFFNGREFLMARVFRVETIYELRQLCLLSFALLVVNEYLQLIPVFGRTFDPYDILSSCLGLSAAYFSFVKLRQRYAGSVA